MLVVLLAIVLALIGWAIARNPDNRSGLRGLAATAPPIPVKKPTTGVIVSDTICLQLSGVVVLKGGTHVAITKWNAKTASVESLRTTCEVSHSNLLLDLPD